MAKTKISEYDSTAANNTDVDGINIAESCPPSGINNAIREVMAHLKDFQTGASGDSLTSAGTLNVTGNLQLDGSAGTSGQVIVSQGSGNTPIWGSGFPSGGIIMWSGTIATIPSGWYLCNGSNGTPDLRNRFIIGANADSSSQARTNVTGTYTQTGGSKNAIVVSHNHTFSATTSTIGNHAHTLTGSSGTGGVGNQDTIVTDGAFTTNTWNTGAAGSHNHSVSGTTSSSGSSGTNANLPPYYALAFIMKA